MLESSEILYHAALSLDVYKKDGRPPLPEGCTQYDEYSDPTTGYYGACYIRNIHYHDAITNFDYYSTDIIFAHRGSDSSLDFDNDKNILMNQIPAQYASAVNFVTNTLNKLNPLSYPTIMGSLNSTIIHVGHSSGAVIADLVASKICYYVFDTGTPIQLFVNFVSSTFSNPGSQPIIQEMIASGELSSSIDSHSSAFLPDVNLVTTCNKQAAWVYQLINMPYQYDMTLDSVNLTPIFPIPIYYGDNNYYTLGYTSTQNSMEAIYNYLQAGGAVSDHITTYPYDFNSGYIAYLDGAARKTYWDGYAKKIWEKSQELQELFAGNYDIFYTDFYKYLKHIQSEAANLNLTEKQPLSPLNYSPVFQQLFKRLQQSPTITVNLETFKNPPLPKILTEPASSTEKSPSLTIEDADLDCSPFSLDVYKCTNTFNQAENSKLWTPHPPVL